MKKPIDRRILYAVIFGIVIIECVALANGINGTLMSLSLVILAGLGGLSLPQLKIK